MKLIANDMFTDGLAAGVWTPIETIEHKQL